MEDYSGIKKEWNTAICSNMDGHRDYHTEWSKTHRERQMLYDITYMWNFKNNTNEFINKTETESQTLKKKKLIVTKGENGRGGIN